MRCKSTDYQTQVCHDQIIASRAMTRALPSIPCGTQAAGAGIARPVAVHRSRFEAREDFSGVVLEYVGRCLLLGRNAQALFRARVIFKTVKPAELDDLFEVAKRDDLSLCIEDALSSERLEDAVNMHEAQSYRVAQLRLSNWKFELIVGHQAHYSKSLALFRN
jgi:hypothetical protein